MRQTFAVALLALVACKNEQLFYSDPNNVGTGEPPPPVNPVQVDRIFQVTEPSVDVLFVIDNSCSMAEEQALLAENFPVFMDYFLTSGLDYHIGVVSTDMETPSHAGKLQRRGGFNYIDRHTPNPDAVFAQMVQLGTGGWFEERGRDAMFAALDLRVDEPTNEGFYRHSAALDVIFVSDENDQSTLITRSEFEQWLDGLKWSDEMLSLHAITAPDLNGACSTAYEIGEAYQHYAAYTEGVEFSICEADWEPMLDTLGLQASGLKREYFLTKIPVVESIEVAQRVQTDGGSVRRQFEVCASGAELEEPECEVVYVPTRNSIVFLEFIPDPLSEVEVTYFISEDYSADPVFEPALP
jgi:hypothetical protein